MGDAPEELPGLRERLRRGDAELYRVPVFDHGITVNEFHAHVIGLVSGVLVAFAYVEGFEWVAYATTVGLVGYALFGPPFLSSLSHDFPEYEKTVALKTVRWEPWHFLGTFLLGVVAVAFYAGILP